MNKDSKSMLGSEASSSSSSLSESEKDIKVEADGEPEINEVDIVYVKEPDDCLCKVCTRKFKCLATIEESKTGQLWWKFRCFMFRVTEHKYFETFIITMILASSSALVSTDKPRRFSLITKVTFICCFYTIRKLMAKTNYILSYKFLYLNLMKLSVNK